MTDVAKRVGGDLHLLAVVFNRQIALSHRVEFMTQVDGAGSLVRLKVIFVDDPKLACRLIGRHGKVEDELGDGAIQPCADATVVLGPSRINRIGSRVPSMCLSNPNLPHMAWKKELHLV